MTPSSPRPLSPRPSNYPAGDRADVLEGVGIISFIRALDGALIPSGRISVDRAKTPGPVGSGPGLPSVAALDDCSASGGVCALISRFVHDANSERGV